MNCHHWIRNIWSSDAEFEQRYIGQGTTENRTIQETLDLGWELLALLPREELDRIDTKLIDFYYPKKNEA